MLSFLKKKGPPDAEAVAMRAIVLRHVVIYAQTSPPREMLAEMMKAWTRDDVVKFGAESRERRDEYWQRLGPYRKHLTPQERAFADTTMESMSVRQQIDASWRVEAFQALVWALGLLQDLPPVGQGADEELLKSFPLTEPGSFVKHAALRPGPTLEAARSVAELWHWRSRTRELIERGDRLSENPQMLAAGIGSYDDIVRTTAQHARANGDIATTIDNDFPVGEKAFRDLSPEEWSEIRSMIVERHFALNWICGLAPSNQWDDTPTDT